MSQLSHLAQKIARHRFLIGLLLVGGIQPIITVMVRTGASYRAVEIGVSVVVIGIITAAYSLVPILLGLKVGRYVDRGHDTRVARISAALSIVSCGGFALSTDWIGLAVFNVIQGISDMTLFLALQVMCARDDRPGAIVRTFGNFMVATSLGQAFGSGMLALIGGKATVAEAQPMFVLALVVSVLMTAGTFLIPSVKRPATTATTTPASIGGILSVPGFAVLLAISIVSVLSIDLALVYLPLIGVERSISVDTVGAMLGVRSIASLAARMSFVRLHNAFGANPLLVASTLVSGLCFIVIALPVPIYALFIAVTISGFTLGIATTTSIATTMSMMTPNKRGTATSMRMIGNRGSQLALPILLGFVAAATGIGAIFGALGAGLLAAAAMGFLRKPAAQTP